MHAMIERAKELNWSQQTPITLQADVEQAIFGTSKAAADVVTKHFHCDTVHLEYASFDGTILVELH
ncbi:MAG: hypothetical protein J2P36_37175 [Ktedonobacteraceae bacterium]|nr:hypothetical protein [Ktedonobacteraceae bacterium]